MICFTFLEALQFNKTGPLEKLICHPVKLYLKCYALMNFRAEILVQQFGRSYATFYKVCHMSRVG